MKIKDFDDYAQFNTRPAHRLRGKMAGPNIGSALLGIACVVAVFGLLTLLYHFG